MPVLRFLKSDVQGTFSAPVNAKVRHDSADITTIDPDGVMDDSVKPDPGQPGNKSKLDPKKV